MNPFRVPNSPERNRAAGVTRLDVLAILAGLLVLGLIALPALANGESKSRALQCLGNLRRLTLGWTLFANDHDGNLVPSRHGGEFMIPGNNSRASLTWATGWLDWTTSPLNTNAAILLDVRYSALAPYLDRDPGQFRCPADTYVSVSQRQRGWTLRARSYSASVAIGPGNAETGPWYGNTYLHAERFSDLILPGPSASIVFMEEHPDSINDPAFFPPSPFQFIDLPASDHSGGGAFAFADGHAWLHRWVSPKTVLPVRFLSTGGPVVPLHDPDLAWVREHTPRPR